MNERISDEIWPNFFIVGAPRSATTSLYFYLKDVPGIFMSRVKEPNYFAPNLYTRYRGKPILPVRNYFGNRSKYLELFKNATGKIAVGEASVAYLSDPDAPGRIKKVIPEARIIMILRDPVERAYSQYLLNVRIGWQRDSFEEAVRSDFYLEPSLYAKPVQRYLDFFGADHVKVLIFEEFIQHPRNGVGEVLKFLGVNAATPANAGTIFNPFASSDPSLMGRFLRSRPVRIAKRLVLPWVYSPRIRSILMKQRVLSRETSKPSMPEKARRFLEDTFRRDALTLEQILGRSLPWFHRLGDGRCATTADGSGNTNLENSHTDQPRRNIERYRSQGR